MAVWTETTHAVGLPMWTADDDDHFILRYTDTQFWLYNRTESGVEGKYETLEDAQAAVP